MHEFLNQHANYYENISHVEPMTYILYTPSIPFLLSLASSILNLTSDNKKGMEGVCC
jgi:hypothetical protein